MCDACVIESVRDRMLSRRALFGGAAAAAAGGLALAPAPARAEGHGGVPVDLTHTLHPDFPTASPSSMNCSGG